MVFVRKGQIVADGTPTQITSLASGRFVRATLRGRSSAKLAAVPGATSVEVRGDTVLVHAHDSDAVARCLLTQTDAYDLEISSGNIEDAFVALTTDEETPS